MNRERPDLSLPLTNVVKAERPAAGERRRARQDHPPVLNREEPGDLNRGRGPPAPCLTLAAVTAAEDQAANVRYVQADAQATGLEAEAFDTVTSTMLLHEMPPPALERLVAESHRLLAPGGVAVHLDFLPGDDPWNKFIHYGHGRRNNEPFMRPLDEMDIAAAHRAAGFREVEVRPFEEMPGALDPSNEAWRFPWTVIVARK